MRCLGCGGFSIRPLCAECTSKFLAPAISKRKAGSLEVISFFGYKDISPLLLSKHTPSGYRLYKYISQAVLKPFFLEFASNIDESVSLVAIDERVSKSGYSHTALLSHHAANSKIIPQHAKLLAGNDITYAGKPLQYRLDHPREFQYRGRSGIEVILIDDIITTGITLQQAQAEIESHDVEVLFAVTLADARL